MSAEEISYEFDEIWGEELFRPIENKRIDITIQNLPVEIEKLLDVGCGNGLFLDKLKEKFKDNIQLYGLDRSKNALSKVRHEIINEDLVNSRIDDQSYDCVTALQVIEHLQYDKYKKD